MTLTSSFSAETFSASLPDITISTGATRVRAVMEFGSTVIYDEVLLPDTEGVVEIGDLPGLVMPFARKQLTGVLNVTLTDQNVTVSSDGQSSVANGDVRTLTTKVTYCAALIDISAAEFCPSHFLTLLQGAKLTAEGRLEYLHYTDTEDAVVKAYYSDKSEKTFEAVKVGGNDLYTTIDVSPSLFTEEGKTLCFYTVTAGMRTQDFELDFRAPDAAPVLLFTNSFGCQEIIYCTGKHQISPEFKYSSAYVGTRMRNYDIEETRTFKADTGVLTFPMAQWLNDLFRSDDVQLLNFNSGEPQPGRYITITDVKSEYSNENDSLPRSTFSYRYAQRNQNVLDTGRAGRIFDNTFDYTFN